MLILLALFACDLEPTPSVDDAPDLLPPVPDSWAGGVDVELSADGTHFTGSRDLLALTGGYGPIEGSVDSVSVDCFRTARFRIDTIASDDPTVVSAETTGEGSFVLQTGGVGQTAVHVAATLMESTPIEGIEWMLDDAEQLACEQRWTELIGTPADLTWHVDVAWAQNLEFDVASACGTNTLRMLPYTLATVPYQVWDTEGREVSRAANWHQGASFEVGRASMVAVDSPYTSAVQVQAQDPGWGHVYSHLGAALDVDIVQPSEIDSVEVTFAGAGGRCQVPLSEGDEALGGLVLMGQATVTASAQPVCTGTMEYAVTVHTPSVCSYEAGVDGAQGVLAFSQGGTCDITVELGGASREYSWSWSG